MRVVQRRAGCRGRAGASSHRSRSSVPQVYSSSAGGSARVTVARDSVRQVARRSWSRVAGPGCAEVTIGQERRPGGKLVGLGEGRATPSPAAGAGRGRRPASRRSSSGAARDVGPAGRGRNRSSSLHRRRDAVPGRRDGLSIVDGTARASRRSAATRAGVEPVEALLGKPSASETKPASRRTLRCSDGAGWLIAEGARPGSPTLRSTARSSFEDPPPRRLGQDRESRRPCHPLICPSSHMPVKAYATSGDGGGGQNMNTS